MDLLNNKKRSTQLLWILLVVQALYTFITIRNWKNIEGMVGQQTTDCSKSVFERFNYTCDQYTPEYLPLRTFLVNNLNPYGKCRLVLFPEFNGGSSVTIHTEINILALNTDEIIMNKVHKSLNMPRIENWVQNIRPHWTLVEFTPSEDSHNYIVIIKILNTSQLASEGLTNLHAGFIAKTYSWILYFQSYFLTAVSIFTLYINRKAKSSSTLHLISWCSILSNTPIFNSIYPSSSSVLNFIKVIMPSVLITMIISHWYKIIAIFKTHRLYHIFHGVLLFVVFLISALLYYQLQFGNYYLNVMNYCLEIIVFSLILYSAYFIYLKAKELDWKDQCHLNLTLWYFGSYLLLLRFQGPYFVELNHYLFNITSTFYILFTTIISITNFNSSVKIIPIYENIKKNYDELQDI
jgi:hypothetical protein